MNRQPTVSDIMNREVVTLDESENLNDVAQDLKRFHLRHLPVVAGKKLVGLVTHRDFLVTTANFLDRYQGRHEQAAELREKTFVGSIMTRDVRTVTPETTIEDAARLLAKTKFGCFPVLNANDELVGIVTEHDFNRYLAKVLFAKRELDGFMSTPPDAPPEGA